jgi:FMN hydrolase / 5-amino-6-(5-phospho-D-ribitylamino)uracil phosphatase
MAPIPSLISLDIGGTLGIIEGNGITEILAAASLLPRREVYRIVRENLHVVPQITESLINRVCRELKIHRSAFPSDYVPAPFRLYPDSLDAIEALSRFAPVVTLSNVCSLDFDAAAMRSLLGPYVAELYPSCHLGRAKPDRAAFQRVADRHSVPISSVLHIGDDWECDVIGALSAGAQAMWISRGRLTPYSTRLSMDRLTVIGKLPAAVVKLHEFEVTSS